jgi:hypothetical protein
MPRSADRAARLAGYHWYVKSSAKDLIKVKAEAKRELGDIEGVLGFGVGDGTLRVYIRNLGIRKSLPTTFRGVDVDFVVTGDITAQA